ncbi:MAG: putative toxin-antitoxin system toxin component, PIN family [Clostridiales bacterium]|nr:putative toxin-antitoxin system toxin component, PIN family [Clostridiales bacterium]MDY3748085.1 putative toxin-antitoxin system toxin component, PIN family [Lachnospiraceae bacterium]
MKYYAVIDTNVLVSAMLKWNSAPGNIMELAFDHVIIPIYNEEIFAEYQNVLSRPKFKFPINVINDFLNEIRNVGVQIHSEPLDMDLPDPKDTVFYEVTMEKRKTEEAYLITGNMKHFPSVPFIVTPREMLEIIANAIE